MQALEQLPMINPIDGRLADLDERLFMPRELSWLSFNAQVLQEAANESVPVIQRLRYLGIFSSNLDEFFRVRVAEIRRLITVSTGGKRSGLRNYWRPFSSRWLISSRSSTKRNRR